MNVFMFFGPNQIAETVGFEPTCRDEPASAFRVRRVTASSLRLHSGILDANGCIIHEKGLFG